MWADGNTKPLQGAGFRLFTATKSWEYVPKDYDDDVEKARTQPLLLHTEAKKAGVVPPGDLKVFAKAMGVQVRMMDQLLSPPMTPATAVKSGLDIMNLGLKAGHIGRQKRNEPRPGTLISYGLYLRNRTPGCALSEWLGRQLSHLMTQVQFPLKQFTIACMW